jgi:hypothetical protein
VREEGTRQAGKARRTAVAIAFVTAGATASAAASASAPAPGKASPSPIQGTLHFGVEVGARWFAYSDPLEIATNLRPYDVAGVPLLELGGELRPLAWTRVRVLEDVGIAGTYAFAPHLTSSITGGKAIQTSWERGNIALRAPIRLGKGERAPVIAPVVGYGFLGFSFQEAGAIGAEIPTVGYRLVRLGLDGRAHIRGPLSMTLAFEYLEPLEGGALYERFRDATIGGIDAHLGVALALAKGTEISLSLGYTRFFSSFEPVPGDPYVAGGALDQFGGIKLGFDHAP